MVEREGPRKAAALKLKRSKSKEIIPRTAKLDNVLAADLLLDILKITEDIADLMPHQLGDQKEHPDAPHDRTANGSLREAVTHIWDIFAYNNSRFQERTLMIVRCSPTLRRFIAKSTARVSKNKKIGPGRHAVEGWKRRSG
uniref:(northern house mosquito) hypothetical protein n=1 Tax=Culex pipiens TaxID=7175 RepID=A0A8D8EXJ2_CULPI